MLIDDEIQKHEVKIKDGFSFGYQQEMGRLQAIRDINEREKQQAIQKAKKKAAEKQRQIEERLERYRPMLMCMGIALCMALGALFVQIQTIYKIVFNVNIAAALWGCIALKAMSKEIRELMLKRHGLFLCIYYITAFILMFTCLGKI